MQVTGSSGADWLAQRARRRQVHVVSEQTSHAAPLTNYCLDKFSICTRQLSSLTEGRDGLRASLQRCPHGEVRMIASGGAAQRHYQLSESRADTKCKYLMGSL